MNQSNPNNPKSIFDQQLQQWLAVDDQLKVLNEKVNELREKKQQLCDNLTKYATTNNLINASIQIGDGKLKFASTRVSNQLTFKYVEKSLGNIIKNEAQVNQIIEYLKTNRDSKMVPEIKRFPSK